jgi:hypothetical protein
MEIVCSSEHSEANHTLTVAGGSWSDTIQFVQLDNIENLLRVARSHGLANELGKPPVKRVLTSLKSCSGGSATSGLLSAHSETASGTLSSRDTSTLSRPGFARAWSGPQSGHSEFKVVHIVNVTLVCLATLPVE